MKSRKQRYSALFSITRGNINPWEGCSMVYPSPIHRLGENFIFYDIKEYHVYYFQQSATSKLFFKGPSTSESFFELIIHESHPLFNLYLLGKLNISKALIAKIYELVEHEIL